MPHQLPPRIPARLGPYYTHLEDVVDLAPLKRRLAGFSIAAAEEDA